MDGILLFLLPSEFPASMLWAAFAIGAFAGCIKGMVGFGLPMLLISGLSTFLGPETALAALIFPTVVSNVWQALRQGWDAAFAAIRAYKIFLIVGGITLVSTAQLVTSLDQRTFFAVVGTIVTLFALVQLTGWIPRVRKTARGEATVGLLAGAMGGVSGIWGPATVAYLTAIGTEKAEQVRLQGVIYGLGSILLLLAHVQSGVVNRETWPLSAFMILPVLIGMLFGLRIQDKIAQSTFRRMTLIVLALAGLNLLRRAAFGA